MIEIYTEPTSYVVVVETLVRIFEGFAISMLVGDGARPADGIEAQHRDILRQLDHGPADVSGDLLDISFRPMVRNIADRPDRDDRPDRLPIRRDEHMGGHEGGRKRPDRDGERIYKADRSLMLRKVLIPQLMPYIFSSLRIALSLSWKIALVAEAFGVGTGVGQKLTYWFQETRVDMMLAWGVSFMIVMVLIDLLVFRTWARRTFAWRPQVAT